MDPADTRFKNVLFTEESYKKHINILLLGETGVGKSTFINGFANYLTHETLEQAKNEEIISCIPSSFTITDENYEEKLIRLGTDENESVLVGQSATQFCKCFVFPFGEYLIRLIDTPGIGDTRGMDQDRLNFDDILAFIGQYPELHCICILMKPNQSRITVGFEFCIKQLLSHLQKSASNNIVFMFTNARGTFYRPGDTGPSLRKILNEIKESPPHVEIPLNRQTAYCLDNESFRFLVAIKNGIKFDDEQIDSFSRSWSASVTECGRLIKYIIGSNDGNQGLKPHKTQETVNVNNARRLIINLSQPLAEIAENIEDNLKVMEAHKQSIITESSGIHNLKKKLYIPYVDLEMIEMKKPKTVCASAECCEIYEVAGLKKHNYVTNCHNPCYLNNIQKEVIGDSSLLNCWAIKPDGNCRVCGCNYRTHLHVYYESKVIEKRKEDQTVKKQISTKEDIRDQAQKMVENIEIRCSKIKKEMETITKATAKFAHFLKNNAIAPYNDSFRAYMEQLISKQESISRCGGNNTEIVNGLRQMLNSYQKQREILDNAMANCNTDCAVTSEDIFESIEELYSLEIYGNKIKESQQTQRKAQKSENYGSEREVVFEPKNRNGNSFFSNVVKVMKKPFS